DRRDGAEVAVVVHDVEDPVAAAEVPDHAADVSEEKALPRGGGSEPLTVFHHSEKRILIAGLQDGVNQRREGHPTEDVKRGFGKDEDLKHAGCGGQHPGIAADEEHKSSLANDYECKIEALSQRLPLLGIDVGLTQDASECADRNLVLPGNDGRIHYGFRASNKFDVAALLGGFDKAG